MALCQEPSNTNSCIRQAIRPSFVARNPSHFRSFNVQTASRQWPSSLAQWHHHLTFYCPCTPPSHTYSNSGHTLPPSATHFTVTVVLVCCTHQSDFPPGTRMFDVRLPEASNPFWLPSSASLRKCRNNTLSLTTRVNFLQSHFHCVTTTVFWMKDSPGYRQIASHMQALPVRCRLHAVHLFQPHNLPRSV